MGKYLDLLMVVLSFGAMLYGIWSHDQVFTLLTMSLSIYSARCAAYGFKYENS